MNPLEKCRPYIFRALGDSETLPGDSEYFFEIVIKGSPSYYIAARDIDGEYLFKSHNFNDRRFMTVVGLTDDQINDASSSFGKFVDGKYVRLSDPLGNV